MSRFGSVRRLVARLDTSLDGIVLARALLGAPLSLLPETLGLPLRHGREQESRRESRQQGYRDEDHTKWIKSQHGVL